VLDAQITKNDTMRLYKEAEEILLDETNLKNWKPKTKKIKEIVEEVGYWRKANQIHNWFVEKVQKGQDNCGEYRVDYEQLRDLLNACEDVLEDHSKAEQLLPRSSGFFFGSTDYDDYYFEQVQNTYDILMSIVSAGDADTQEYVYQSSW
jgi:DNA repair exonuclease SbcCD ATPase subunit